MVPKPDFKPAADEVVYAPTAALLAPPPRKRNPTPRKKKPSKWSLDEFELYDGHEGLLVRTMLVRSQAHTLEREPVVIRSAADVYKLCRHLGNADQEHMVVLSLNRNGEVTAIYEVAIGTGSATMAARTDILKIPILTGCLAFILVHNHPSGSLDPSAEDHKMTKNLMASTECVGLTMFDHIIVSRNGYTSFMERGLIGH